MSEDLDGFDSRIRFAAFSLLLYLRSFAEAEDSQMIEKAMLDATDHLNILGAG